VNDRTIRNPRPAYQVAAALAACVLAAANPARAVEVPTPTISGYARATHVIIIRRRSTGDFAGCDFDRLIPLANGLIFHCAEYYYHYASSPKVQIIMLEHGRTIVSIDGRRYHGSLVRSDEP
jgi:hypothetical protein